LRSEALLRRQAEELSNRLGKLNHVAFTSFVEKSEALPEPGHFWRQIVGIDAQPDSKISNNASQSDIHQWLRQMENIVGLKGEALIAFGGFQLPWAKVDLMNEAGWLTELWSSLPNHDFLTLDTQATFGLGFTEEEHGYYAFLLRG